MRTDSRFIIRIPLNVLVVLQIPRIDVLATVQRLLWMRRLLILNGRRQIGPIVLDVLGRCTTQSIGHFDNVSSVYSARVLRRDVGV